MRLSIVDFDNKMVLARLHRELQTGCAEVAILLIQRWRDDHPGSCGTGADLDVGDHRRAVFSRDGTIVGGERAQDKAAIGPNLARGGR